MIVTLLLFQPFAFAGGAITAIVVGGITSVRTGCGRFRHGFYIFSITDQIARRAEEGVACVPVGPRTRLKLQLIEVTNGVNGPPLSET